MISVAGPDWARGGDGIAWKTDQRGLASRSSPDVLELTGLSSTEQRRTHLHFGGVEVEHADVGLIALAGSTRDDRERLLL